MGAKYDERSEVILQDLAEEEQQKLETHADLHLLIDFIMNIYKKDWAAGKGDHYLDKE